MAKLYKKEILDPKVLDKSYTQGQAESFYKK